MKRYSEIFGWGNNSFGQLGITDSSKSHESIPRSYTFQILISSLSCGNSHTLILSSTGHIYSFGNNDQGQLGLSENLPSISSPSLLESLSKISKISCGGSFSMALSISGILYTWGQGSFGNLGTGLFKNEYTPKQIDFSASLTCLQISAGSKHSAVILTNGQNSSLFVSGEGSQGQLGSGKFQKEPIYIKVIENVMSVSCGYEHTAVINNCYKLLVTGNNDEGQLGLSVQCSPNFVKPNCEDVLKVSCSNLTVCITTTGKVLVAGSYMSGFNHVKNKFVISDIEAGGGYFLARNCNKALNLWEGGKFKCFKSLSEKNIEKISAGKDFFLLIGNEIQEGCETTRKIRTHSVHIERGGATCRNTHREEFRRDYIENESSFRIEKENLKKIIDSLQKELEESKQETRRFKQKDEKEMTELRYLLEKLNHDNKLLREENESLKILTQENEKLKLDLRNAFKEKQELVQINLKLDSEFKTLFDVKSDALYHLEKLETENNELKLKIAELVQANTDITKQVEEGINFQVRNYKEKTLDLLNTSSKSPRFESRVLGPVTPQKENINYKLNAINKNRSRVNSIITDSR